MSPEKINPKFIFTKAAVYKIKVQGDLPENWSERLGGLQINVERTRDEKPISVLIGEIKDQSALSRVLNTLFELHLSLISVSILKDTEV